MYVCSVCIGAMFCFLSDYCAAQCILSDIRAKLDLIRIEVAAIPSASLWLLPYGLPPG